MARRSRELAAVARVGSGAPKDRLWRIELLEVVRRLAFALGYCESAPFGLAPSQPRVGGSTPFPDQNPNWVYADRRVELHKHFVWVDGPVNLAVILPAKDFGVGIAAFDRERGQLDVDSLAIGILREMRHMATPEYGDGQLGVSDAARDAEHGLNELEDYSSMFVHPYALAIAERKRMNLCREYSAGRSLEYRCFVRRWNPNDGHGGFPPDTVTVRLGAITLGDVYAGPMVLSQPADPMQDSPGLRLDGMPCAAAPVGPVINLPPLEQRCGDPPVPLSASERRTVASWAVSNQWMRMQMIGSVLGNETQPWNTLAHYALGPPIRMTNYCASPPAPARPAARTRTRRH